MEVFSRVRSPNVWAIKFIYHVIEHSFRDKMLYGVCVVTQ
jgi:hypothetical protein